MLRVSLIYYLEFSLTYVYCVGSFRALLLFCFEIWISKQDYIFLEIYKHLLKLFFGGFLKAPYKAFIIAI
jgi:hypothetical protein